ncbi:cyclic GMP-AMP synthase-like receptor 1 isoform X2 [Palaemon carinicauda]|uniref:cyclic GMP-AMP synthase-like receptor 1 isoform X2 n=1 Tax=Palaemon carinicauda TaxID=392227 RepID=UPI0035B66C60
MDFRNIEAAKFLKQINRQLMPIVKSNRDLVNVFLDELRHSLRNDEAPQSFAIQIIHVGSSYEKLVVDTTADFDILVSLREEYVSENFYIERDPSGYFLLEAREDVTDIRYLDYNNYLDSSKLRSSIFKKLIWHIRQVFVDDTTIKCQKGLAALNVKLYERSGQRRRVSIDFVPQIPVHTWGQCPDLLSLSEMPRCLRQYIDRTNRHKNPCMFFSLGIPKADMFPNVNLLFNPSFPLLEKNFINEETDIQDMVLLVKYIAKKRNWEDEHHFKSFHAKRVALKYYDELTGMEPWDGCLRLLKKLEKEVASGAIDGYFVIDQPLRKWKRRESQDFIREIKTVKRMNIRDI